MQASLILEDVHMHRVLRGEKPHQYWNLCPIRDHHRRKNQKTIKNTFFVVESAHYKMKSNFLRIGVIERHPCSEVVEERGIAKKVVRTL